MFITKEELDKRLNSAVNLSNVLEDRTASDKKQADKDIDKVLEGVLINRTEKIKTGVQGRVAGDENVPTIFRDIITAQAVSGEKAKDLTKAWGVSASRISDYKNGIPNRANPEATSNKEVQSVIEKVTGRIRDKVCEKIELALDAMTPERFNEESNLKVLSTITSNLARTAQALEQKKENGSVDNRVQTIIYAPQNADIKEYTTLEVAR